MPRKIRTQLINGNKIPGNVISITTFTIYLKLLDRKQNNLIAVARRSQAIDTRRWICSFCNVTLLGGTSEINCWAAHQISAALASDNNLPRSEKIASNNHNQLPNYAKGYRSGLTCDFQLCQKSNTVHFLKKNWSKETDNTTSTRLPNI